MNKLMLQGRLTKDVELIIKEVEEKDYCYFTVAVKGKDEATYIDVKAFGNNARYISQYGKKGAFITLEAHLQNYTQDIKGKKVYMISVVVDKVYTIIDTNRENKVTE